MDTEESKEPLINTLAPQLSGLPQTLEGRLNAVEYLISLLSTTQNEAHQCIIIQAIRATLEENQLSDSSKDAFKCRLCVNEQLLIALQVVYELTD